MIEFKDGAGNIINAADHNANFQFLENRCNDGSASYNIGNLTANTITADTTVVANGDTAVNQLLVNMSSSDASVGITGNLSYGGAIKTVDWTDVAAPIYTGLGEDYTSEMSYNKIGNTVQINAYCKGECDGTKWGMTLPYASSPDLGTIHVPINRYVTYPAVIYPYTPAHGIIPPGSADMTVTFDWSDQTFQSMPNLNFVIPWTYRPITDKSSLAPGTFASVDASARLRDSGTFVACPNACVSLLPDNSGAYGIGPTAYLSMDTAFWAASVGRGLLARDVIRLDYWYMSGTNSLRYTKDYTLSNLCYLNPSTFWYTV
jgi:hypothetical protein